MKTAILEHRHKHGHDTYVALVGDGATMADQDAIIEYLVRAYDIDYEPEGSGQEEGFGEELELRLMDRHEVGVIPVGFKTDPEISKGVWRYSEEGEDVTTSRLGVLEGSRRVCHVGNTLKSRGEVNANGRAIAAVPEMVDALKDVQLYLETNGRSVVRKVILEKVDAALRKVRASSVSGSG